MSQETHKDFMLSALRAASLRAKMIEMDLNTVGVALKADMVTPLESVDWLRQIGALDFVGKIPAAIEEIAADTTSRIERKIRAS